MVIVAWYAMPFCDSNRFLVVFLLSAFRLSIAREFDHLDGAALGNHVGHWA